MKSMSQFVSPATSAATSFHATSRPRMRNNLAILCAVLAVLFSCAGSIVSAQTAHFSGSTPIDWVQTPLLVSAPGFPGGIAVDRSGNIYVANYGQVVLKNTPSGNNNYVQS